MKFFIKCFRLIGTEKNYTINFKKGLNFISGPTSTGKTTIFELINYVLGAKDHKQYIEIGEKCTDVELEVSMNGNLFRIKRALFDFKLPVLVEIFDKEFDKFIIYSTFNVDETKEDSYSSFLLSQVNLDGIKISNQNFSFRDLFKFSYLKQTKIDNEDILSTSHWMKNRKEKATFEILFNIYNGLIGELKETLKVKNEEYNEEKIKYEGIKKFIKSSEIKDYSSVREIKNNICLEIEDVEKKLESNIEKIKEESSSNEVDNFRKSIIESKSYLKKIQKELSDQKQYIVKLNLLYHQYESDISKIDAVIMGVKELNKYQFIICPNCLQPLSEHVSEESCRLCGNHMQQAVENTVILKAEKSEIKKKRNELEKHISNEKMRNEELKETFTRMDDDIKGQEQLLDKLTKQYISPYYDEVSFLNVKLGTLNQELKVLENDLNIIQELNRLEIILLDKEKEVLRLKESIKKQSNKQDKESTLKKLSDKLKEILIEFQFPKLRDSGVYIDERNYLPYVRGRKYDDLGSLGAVSLITMAYYLAILLESDNHLNLLMIDTPGKNLGAHAATDDFQDEEILEAIIKYLMKLDEEFLETIQLFVINNGYPEILSKDKVILDFSPDGRQGLIDDI